MNHYLLKRLLVITALIGIGMPLLANAEQGKQVAMQKQLAALETSSGGRLGVYAVNTANNQRVEYHAKDRFPMCSTNKIMGVAAVLKKSMKDHHLLQKKIHYKKTDLIAWSPITKKHLVDGMTIVELCKAAITYSNNAAINLLMKKLGGVKAVNVFARSIGDNTFRLDRFEPALNSAIPGDLRDTSTPAAMGKSLQELVFGNTLGLAQRKQLQMWLKGNTTGDARIRAGVPKAWVVGDKTGTCGYYGTTNDIGIIWPPNSAPIVVAVYFTQPKEDAAARDDVIASVARIVTQYL